MDSGRDELLISDGMVRAERQIEEGIAELLVGLLSIDISPPNHYNATLIRGFDDEVFTVPELAQSGTLTARQVAPSRSLVKVETVQS